jgi:hypothetical protein
VTEVESLARQVDERVTAYRQAEHANERVPENVRMRNIRESVYGKPMSESSRRLRAIVEDLHEAQEALIEVVLRAARTTEEEHLANPHPVTVSTSQWMVTVAPRVLDDEDFSPVVLWDLFIAPRSRNVVVLE